MDQRNPVYWRRNMDAYVRSFIIFVIYLSYTNALIMNTDIIRSLCGLKIEFRALHYQKNRKILKRKDHCKTMSLPQTPCLGAMTETPSLDAAGAGVVQLAKYCILNLKIV